ncbi:MAG: carbohydrate-binding protein, partial [Chitinophagaceae bacterium]
MNIFTRSTCRRSLSFVLITLVLFTQITAQEYIGRQKVDQFPTTSWGAQTYGLTWLPTDYNNSNEKYPLIIFLHGSGETGTSVGSLNNLISTALPQKIAQGWNPEATNPLNGQKFKFIVVSPQAPNWSYSYTHLQYILADITKRYRVDASRVYITGLSAGGAGSWSAVTNGENFAKKIAAIVPVSGAGTNTTSESDQIYLVGGTYGVKTWSICGTGDSFWSLAQTYTNTVNNASPAPSTPDLASGIAGAGHSSAAWNTAYDANWRNNAYNLNIYEWLLRYTRNGNSSSSSNQSPFAAAGADKTINLPSNSVELNGGGNDPDGYITKYKWSKVGGPSSYQFGNNNNNNDDDDDDDDDDDKQNVTVSQLVQGTYTFRLKVTDNKGASSTDDVTVTVNNASAPPPPPSSTTGYVTIPARIEAEHWSNMSGVQAENTADIGGGSSVGYIHKDDWLEYRINAPSAGTYVLS